MKSRSAWPSCGVTRPWASIRRDWVIAVDLVADVGHLLRRHHRLLGIRPGRRRDQPDRRLAVEEDLLDHVLPREVGQRAAVGGELRVQPPRLRRSPSSACFDTAPAARLRVVRVVPGPDVVQLHVEDEERLARALLERGGVGGLDRAARRRTGRRPRSWRGATSPSRRSSAGTRGGSSPSRGRQPVRLGEDPRPPPRAARRLGQRRELLVGDEPGRQRHLAAQAPPHAGAEPERVAVLNGHGRLLGPQPDAPPIVLTPPEASARDDDTTVGGRDQKGMRARRELGAGVSGSGQDDSGSVPGHEPAHRVVVADHLE